MKEQKLAGRETLGKRKEKMNDEATRAEFEEKVHT
jgi:hypothetical protein